jgi:hypothetical protein
MKSIYVVIAQFHYKYKDAAKTIMSLLILDTASSSSVSPIELAAEELPQVL